MTGANGSSASSSSSFTSWCFFRQHIFRRPSQTAGFVIKYTRGRVALLPNSQRRGTGASSTCKKGGMLAGLIRTSTLLAFGRPWKKVLSKTAIFSWQFFYGVTSASQEGQNDFFNFVELNGTLAKILFKPYSKAHRFSIVKEAYTADLKSMWFKQFWSQLFHVKISNLLIARNFLKHYQFILKPFFRLLSELHRYDRIWRECIF